MIDLLKKLIKKFPLIRKLLQERDELRKENTLLRGYARGFSDITAADYQAKCFPRDAIAARKSKSIP